MVLDSVHAQISWFERGVGGRRVLGRGLARSLRNTIHLLRTARPQSSRDLPQLLNSKHFIFEPRPSPDQDNASSKQLSSLQRLVQQRPATPSTFECLHDHEPAFIATTAMPSIVRAIALSALAASAILSSTQIASAAPLPSNATGPQPGIHLHKRGPSFNWGVSVNGYEEIGVSV